MKSVPPENKFQFLAAAGKPRQASIAAGAGKTEPPPLEGVRRGLLVLSVIVGLCGAWMLAPALLAPQPGGLPLNRDQADAAYARRPRALLAAQIAVIRGDLWAEAAFTGARFIWGDPSQRRDPATPKELNSIRVNAETALKLAPINAAAWLFLSVLTPSAPEGGSQASTFLEMSYLTAPNDARLAPLRLLRAATSTALANKDLQFFVANDIKELLHRGPEHQQDIVAAYQAAWPQNQPVLAALAADIDPEMARLLNLPESK